MLCGSCGAAQSPTDEQWQQEVREIYEAYRSFQTYGGPEQQVLDASTGQLRRRSLVLLDRLAAIAGFPCGGSVLDVGCGGGATLRGFAESGAWRCFGFEMDDRDLPLLRSIPNFEGLYTCPARELPLRFDVITMVHSLEHFPGPADVLADLLPKLAPGGRLFIQVPNAAANPLDLVVADHMLHFTPSTLRRIVRRAGYDVDTLSTAWISKELSLIARPAATAIQTTESGAEEAIQNVCRQVKWLDLLAKSAHESALHAENFGIFGATIAASWLCGVLGDRVKFFVDEDANRAGRMHLERPVLDPEQVPPGSTVFLALTPHIASQVAGRLRNGAVHYCLPPE
jgi:2-polyprenyl-3-methyl-5-hydroxy-6-metoxy-1,4-benzoquinol methylase